jgi:hypothetical protein
MISPSSNASPAPGSGRGPIRLPLVLGAALVILLAVAGLKFAFRRPAEKPEAPAPVEEPSAYAQMQARAAALKRDPAPAETAVPPAPVAPVTPAPSPVPDPTALTPPPVALTAPGSRAEATTYTRRLVENLTRFDPAAGPVTPEFAAQWKGELSKLVQEGGAGAAAIRDYLEKKEDVNFEKLENGSALGAKSMRLALIDALREIGGPEAIAASAQILSSTTNPREIASLARGLEQLAPEQYRDAAVSAARTALGAAQRNLGANDVAPLFEVLQQYGGAAAIPDLEAAAGQWHFYAPIALAALPDGAGVPSLVRMAYDPEGGASGNNRIALQMLAELSLQNPTAAEALTGFVRGGKVPPSAWYGIAAALGGTRTTLLENSLGAGPAVPNTTDPKTYHIPANRQNYGSANFSGSWTPQQREQQVALIDQLRAADATAAQMLAPVKAALTSAP